MICIWSSKIQNGLPFWCQSTQVVMEKRLFNGLSSNSYILSPAVKFSMQQLQ